MPIGPLLLAGDQAGPRYLSFAASRRAQGLKRDWREKRSPFTEVIRQLDEYFLGKRRQFHVPLALDGTQFQLRVWNRLLQIPYGETLAYGQLAREIGAPRAARAVGLANGMNPIHHCALSPRDWHQWQPDWLWRPAA